jgi:hypothetical protein
MHDRILDENVVPMSYLEELKERGMCVLRNVLPPDLVQEAHAQARVALQTEHVRSQKYQPDVRVGYTAPRVEGTKRTGPITHRHFFDYRAAYASIEPMDDVFYSLYDELLLTGVEWFSQLGTGYGIYVLRIAECLNDAVDPELELFPPHIDFGLLTFFLGGSSEGLEVYREGKWVPVYLPAGDILVGTGSIFKQYFPNSPALRHRVMARSVRRLSLFMFIDPHPATVLPNGENAQTFFERIMKDVRY